MSAAPHPVAIITGGKRGIGADVAAAFRRGGYAVVATSRSIPASDDSDVLTVQGDITDAETSRRVVEQALERFGRIDSLINNAGVYIGKPFTDYTSDDYAAITAVNLAGFFNITQQAIGRWSPNGDQTKLAMLTNPTASSSCGSLIATRGRARANFRAAVRVTPSIGVESDMSWPCGQDSPPKARMPPTARPAPRGERRGLLVLTAGPALSSYWRDVTGPVDASRSDERARV